MKTSHDPNIIVQRLCAPDLCDTERDGEYLKSVTKRLLMINAIKDEQLGTHQAGLICP